MHLRCAAIVWKWEAVTIFVALFFSLIGITVGKIADRDVGRFDKDQHRNREGREATLGVPHLVRKWEELQPLSPMNNLYGDSDVISRLCLYISKWRQKLCTENAEKTKLFHLLRPSLGDRQSHETVKQHNLYDEKGILEKLSGKLAGWICRNPPRLKNNGGDGGVVWSGRRNVPIKDLLQHSDRGIEDNLDYVSKIFHVKRRLLHAEVSSLQKSSTAKGNNVTPSTTAITSTNNYTDFIASLRKQRWRARHNEDAWWGLACTAFILIILLWAVWFSGMCKPKSEEFVHVEYCTAIQQMSVQEMLKNRARHLPIFKSRFRKKPQSDNIPLLDVETQDSDEDDKVFDQRWEGIDS